MDVRRLRNDLRILIELQRKGLITGVDWKIDGGLDNWIIIYGAMKLPQDIFNLEELNIKLPVSMSLYEPTSRGRFSFYNVILVDSKLRRKTRNGWDPIARQFGNMYPDEARRGWNFVCIYPRDCRGETDVRAIFGLIQKWAIDNGDKGR